MNGNPMAMLGSMSSLMNNPAIKNFQKKMKENPTMITDTVESIRTATLKLNGFIDTYIGVYDEKGNQIEKGDRDIIFETLAKILENQKMILERLDKLDSKED